MLPPPKLCRMPLPTQIRFAELIEQHLVPLLQADPDAAAIDWSRVEWLKANQPWQPEPARSLADNGITHKTQLRLRTPGLNSLCGARGEGAA